MRRKRCRGAGIAASMGSVGDCFDNAMCESFSASLECELISRGRWRTHGEARIAVFDYIDAFSNPRRRHSWNRLSQPRRVRNESNRSDHRCLTAIRPRKRGNSRVSIRPRAVHLLVIGDDHELKLEAQRHTGDPQGWKGPVTLPGPYARPEASAPVCYGLPGFVTGAVREAEQLAIKLRQAAGVGGIQDDLQRRRDRAGLFHEPTSELSTMRGRGRYSTCACTYRRRAIRPVRVSPMASQAILASDQATSA